MVAVDDIAEAIHRKTSIGVAVERGTGIGAVGHHCVNQIAEVGRATGLVDVQPVGRGVDLDHRSPRATQGVRADEGRGTIGAVDDDGEPIEAVRQGREKVRDIKLGPLAVI
ncbi:unannotated protein [freshwater metagenome]|uniref:Unannotated protein n=1 Tax=freshwater metagenome TaxID=449393 RepID=A0A6J7BX65_9ZZZZ